jgi:glycosyltransferase involved in cell wall biosynthesis
MSAQKPRIVIAGQLPPPFGGQNIMIGKAIAQFAQSDSCEAVHLPFFFTPELKQARQGHPHKAFELFRVIWRLFRIRTKGAIDVLLYPTGGPQKVAMIRDLLLLPWIFLLSRCVVLHFHAAGIADQLERGSIIAWLLKRVYGKAVAAVVMTDFGRRDPAAIGIQRVFVLPWRLPDDFDPGLVHRNQNGTVRLLHVGHLCADKGTPQLLQAFATLRRNLPDLELDLVGECLPPFSQELLDKLLDDLDIRSHVRVSGLLTGRAKAEAFGRADLFVFPTVAPYESFGLVLAEAMAWKLPIVASQWRGNGDVLTSHAGAITFPVSTDLDRGLAVALEQAFENRSGWREWGETNRTIFEERYRENGKESALVSALRGLVVPAPARRRILYVHNSADMYGASRSLFRLLQGLDRDRVDPIVLLPEEGALRSAIEKLGVRVIVDPTLAIISRYISWFVVLAWRFPRSLFRLVRLIRKEKVDLVHTNTAVILSTGLAAKIVGIPHVWYIRESFHEEGLRHLWNLYSSYIRKVSNKIVAVSNATAAQFSDRSKVVVIHNGFSLAEFVVSPIVRNNFRQQFDLGEGELVTGCVGRIKWGRKGQEHLIQAAQLLKARGIISKILIVGSPFPGNELHLARLKDLARELNVENQIIFTGELTDAKPAYANMDVFVLPSAYPEPFGGVVMEAMSMGLPVIATKLGGSLDQVLEGVTGFLVPPADPEALAARIAVLAKDSELRRRMGAAGKTRIAEKFSLTEMVRKVEHVYDSVTSQKSFPPQMFSRDPVATSQEFIEKEGSVPFTSHI